MGLASRFSEASHDCLLCTFDLMMRKLQTSAACRAWHIPSPRCMLAQIVAKECSLIWTNMLQGFL